MNDIQIYRRLNLDNNRLDTVIILNNIVICTISYKGKITECIILKIKTMTAQEFAKILNSLEEKELPKNVFAKAIPYGYAMISLLIKNNIIFCNKRGIVQLPDTPIYYKRLEPILAELRKKYKQYKKDNCKNISLEDAKRIFNSGLRDIACKLYPLKQLLPKVDELVSEDATFAEKVAAATKYLNDIIPSDGTYYYISEDKEVLSLNRKLVGTIPLNSLEAAKLILEMW